MFHYTQKLNEVKQACKTLASRLEQIAEVDAVYKDSQFVGALQKAQDGLKELAGTTFLEPDLDAYAEMEAAVDVFVAIQKSLKQFPTKENKRTCQEHLEQGKTMLNEMKRHLESVP